MQVNIKKCKRWLKNFKFSIVRNGLSWWDCRKLKMWCSYRFRKEKMDCKFLLEWGQKWSQLIRLHNSWINYIWSKNWWINLTFGIQIDLRNVKSCSKILSCAWLKILSANRIVGFLNQLYLKKSWWIGLFFWHEVIDSRSIKDDF